MPISVIDNLTGGLSKRDAQLLKDNQFEDLKNWYYNQDKRLQSRRGISQYFPVVPDTVVLIDALNATTGWSASDDADTLATGTAIRGTFALQFNVNVAASGNDFATVEKSTLAADISSAKGYIGFWLFVPTGFNTNLTDVKIRLGSDSTNYYEWTLGTLTENTSQFIKLAFSTATTTGTPNDASIAYARFRITYTAAYTNKTGVRIDDIQAYSSTYTKPVTSYFSNRNEADLSNITICVAGANMFLYNQTADSWERIDSSLSEFETLTGKTTQRTRWEFFAYNGSGTMEVGTCNGVDNYRVWNGVTMTQYAAQPKCRYFLVHEDTIYSTGADATPLALFYTAASPANAQTINTNDVAVGNEEDGRTNGLFPLVGAVMIGKTEKKYYFDAVSGTCLPLDDQNGFFSQRASKNVGNGVLYQTKNGIDNLQQKTYATGSAAVVSEPYSADLQEMTSQITANQLNANCGQYVKELNNYYFSFDTLDDNVPDTTLVYSSLVGKAWSEYTYPAAYCYGVFIDSNNAYNYLLCSAVAGIIYKIETGFDDDGVPIEYSFSSKAYNLKSPYNWKDYEYITISGLKNEGPEFEFDVVVDGNVVYTATLNDSFLTSSTAVATIGSDPIGSVAIGGGGEASSGIEVFPYLIRLGAEIFASGQTVQIRGRSSDSPLVMTIDRMEIKYQNATDDLFPIANFA